MGSKLKLAVLSVVTVLIAAVTAVPAQASTMFAYGATAGATQITAVGTTITSDATAPSGVFGSGTGATNSNKIVSLDASPLAYVSTGNTDATSTAQGDGWKATSHARTGTVSILGGLIRVQAVDTVTTTSADSNHAGAASANTQFLGLVINGKSYPVDIAQNTGINIPGVASITLNFANISTTSDSAVAIGAGLVVTLLQARNGVAAGARIVLNPTFSTVQPTNAGGGPLLGGAAYGAYINAHVGEAVKAETGRIPLVTMPYGGTAGRTTTNSTAAINVNGVLNTGAVESSAFGATSAAYSRTTMSSKILRLRLFPSLVGSLISADAIGTVAQVEKVDGVYTINGSMQFVNLKIAGQSIPVDVGPNTTIHVANLGMVTINEQKTVAVDGWMHGIAVTGLHITLDTARAGLPVGAEIQIATSAAIIWQ